MRNPNVNEGSNSYRQKCNSTVICRQVKLRGTLHRILPHFSLLEGDQRPHLAPHALTPSSAYSTHNAASTQSISQQHSLFAILSVHLIFVHVEISAQLPLR